MLLAAPFAARSTARSAPRRTFRTRRVAARIRTRNPNGRVQLRLESRPRRAGPRVFEPAAAVERLRASFQAIARRMAPRDAFLREDLAQEMALAVLALQRPRTLARFRTWAAWRARDYLRRFGAPVKNGPQRRKGRGL